MTSRHALILAVPEIANDSNLNLSVVEADADHLARALRQSSYDVSVRGTTKASDVTRSLIGTAIRDACKRVPADGTLLIFFTGHGIHSNGHDYLLPWDADLQEPYDDTLFRVGDIAKWIDVSTAAQIVLFIDACREGLDRTTKAVNAHVKQWGTEKRRRAHGRQYSIVFSCKAGEYSHYVPDPDGYSLFSRALSQALSIENPARTLNDVIAATQALLDKSSRENDKPQQTITNLFESDVSSDPGEGIICEGRTATGSEKRTGTWKDAVLHSTLWRYVDNEQRDSKKVAAYRSIVIAFAERAEQSYRRTIEAIRSDPWRDGDYPKRVIRQIEEITAGGGVFDLSLPEVALLLIAPMIREEAYASATVAFVAALPTEIEVSPDVLPREALEYRRRLEIEFRSYPQPIRRVRRLRNDVGKKKAEARHKAESANFIMFWLLHRHLRKFAPMWHEMPNGTLAIVSASELVGGDIDVYFGEAFTYLASDRILKLAKCVGGEPDRLTRRDMPHPLEPAVRPSAKGESVRERLVGSILCLAGWMALDVRAADDAIVDHIGIGDPLDPRKFVATVVSAVWKPAGRALQLHAKCGHPAVDFALRNLVADANRILTEITAIFVDVEGLPDLAKDFPGQLSGNGIVAIVDKGRPAYTIPHQQFTLAQNEVRELLMGEELYGDPDLAIRELYQNALDACRYRRARHQFLARGGKQVPWEGKIEFRQGVDGGRSYVECHDNGIGMGVHEINSCFSRAGKRFADLPEFIEEQELWLQCDPKIEMTPNSQFGVGVLSYFMIADEVELSTCRLDREGRPGLELSIRIPGGGTLFRIQPTGRAVDAGTRVRLYLREDWRNSCCSILERLLFLAEFETEASDGQQNIKWQPGFPRQSDKYLRTNNPDFWWSHAVDGQVLADGIATSLSHNDKLGKSSQPTGALVNLKSNRRPKLTVDRKRILGFDQDWVLQCYTAEIAHLIAAPWLRLTWLWELSDRVREVIERELIERKVDVPIGYAKELQQYRVRRFAKIENIAPFLELGFPLRVIGINEVDKKVVPLLAAAIALKNPTAYQKLDLLDEICESQNLMRGRPEDQKEIDSWSAQILLTLTTNALFCKDAGIYRAALFVKLGFPTRDWLREILEAGVYIDIDAVAKKLTPGLHIKDRSSSIIEALLKILKAWRF